MFRRTPTNCEPIRRQPSGRTVAQVLIVVLAVAGGLALMWQISPHDDLWALEVAMAQGAFGGGLVGVIVAAQLPGRPRRRADR
jgi:uncharacterized membrane protein YfcA